MYQACLHVTTWVIETCYTLRSYILSHGFLTSTHVIMSNMELLHFRYNTCVCHIHASGGTRSVPHILVSTFNLETPVLVMP